MLEIGLARCAASEHLRPTEDRAERRPQLVRERRQKVVLYRAQPLGFGARGAFGTEELLALLRRLLRQRAKLLLVAAQGFFGLFARGDVAHDFRCADDLSIRIAYRRRAQRNIDPTAVFAHAHRFVMLDTLALPQLTEYEVLFAVKLDRNDFPDRLTDHLFSAVTEDALRALVPARDDALERLADDAVVRALHDRREPRLRIERLFLIRFSSVMSRVKQRV